MATLTVTQLHGFLKGKTNDASLSINNVVTNRPAAEAGLAVLASGGDFADGVIAFDGAWLGGQVFVSFDKKTVQLLEENGYSCQLLAGQDV